MTKTTRIPKPKYFFSVEPRIETIPVGEVPGGFRVDLRYVSAGSAVWTDPEAYDRDWAGPDVSYKTVAPVRKQAQADSPLAAALSAGTIQWPGIDGEVLSGTDWATVRTDGVMTFDGRVTLKTDDDFLVDAVISGVVDLCDPSKPRSDAESRALYTSWLNGGIAYPVPLLLAVHFEAANNVESWANVKIKRASSSFWKYARLVRGQFAAVGEMVLGKTTYSPLSRVSLDVYEVSAGEAR
jgi:hypothetical protein